MPRQRGGSLLPRFALSLSARWLFAVIEVIGVAFEPFRQPNEKPVRFCCPGCRRSRNYVADAPIEANIWIVPATCAIIPKNRGGTSRCCSNRTLAFSCGTNFSSAGSDSQARAPIYLRQ